MRCSPTTTKARSNLHLHLLWSPHDEVRPFISQNRAETLHLVDVVVGNARIDFAGERTLDLEQTYIPIIAHMPVRRRRQPPGFGAHMKPRLPDREGGGVAALGGKLRGSAMLVLVSRPLVSPDASVSFSPSRFCSGPGSL